MINLTIQNNYIQFGWSRRVMWQVKVYNAHVFIRPASLCLLVGAFNPFTFKVIIDMYDPITVFLIVWGLFSVDKSFPSLVSCLEKLL